MTKSVSNTRAAGPPRPVPAHVDDLAEVLAETFRLVSRGVADRRSRFRTPTVATIGPNNAPGIRTMVLRAFDVTARCLTLHTERRAGKIYEIARTPRVAVHVWDGRTAVQIRLSALARVHAGDDTAHAAWAAVPVTARAIYAIDPAPGAEVPAPPPAPTDQGHAFANFAVLALTFDSLEWLWLDKSGHRRARFTWDADGAHHAAWLVP
jgi:pyridoxamine 5'-phosphate oxidase